MESVNNEEVDRTQLFGDGQLHGVYLIFGRISPDLALQPGYVRKRCKGRWPARHWSLYTQGSCFDITSAKANDRCGYLKEGMKGTVWSVAFRETRMSHEDQAFYLCIRLGLTRLPLWMIAEAGARLASLMRHYSFILRNCNQFILALFKFIIHKFPEWHFRTVQPWPIAVKPMELAVLDREYIFALTSRKPRRHTSFYGHVWQFEAQFRFVKWGHAFLNRIVPGPGLDVCNSEEHSLLWGRSWKYSMVQFIWIRSRCTMRAHGMGRVELRPNEIELHREYDIFLHKIKSKTCPAWMDKGFDGPCKDMQTQVLGLREGTFTGFLFEDHILTVQHPPSSFGEGGEVHFAVGRKVSEDGSPDLWIASECEIVQIIRTHFLNTGIVVEVALLDADARLPAQSSRCDELRESS